MDIHLLLLGIIFGFMVAVPVGPLGLLCVNRSLAVGRLYGLFSGLGAATADLAAGIVAGISLISGFLTDHQILFASRWRDFPLLSRIQNLQDHAYAAAGGEQCPELTRGLRNDFSPDVLLSGDDSLIHCDLCGLGCGEPKRAVSRRCLTHPWGIYRLGALVGCLVYRANGFSRQIQLAGAGVDSSCIGSSNRRIWICRSTQYFTHQDDVGNPVLTLDIKPLFEQQ